MNNVDVTDPHRNFTSDEWDKLGSGGRAYVLRLRDAPASSRGGWDGGRGGGPDRSDGSQRNASAASTATNDQATAQRESDQSVVSELTERGSQHGRNFGRGAYT
jgi:hypothetical protein